MAEVPSLAGGWGRIIDRSSSSLIGASLQRGRAVPAFCVGISTVVLDWMLIWLNRYPESNEGRWALALVSCTILVKLADGDLASIGLATPAGGWRHWLRISGVLTAIVLGVAAIAFAAWHLRGKEAPANLMPMQNIGSALIPMCLLAPLLEESIYRMVLCTGVAAALGGRWAILISGISFSLLHLLYGNPSLENQLGGFVLAWTFVSSGSIYVPLLLHAGGNALVLLAHAGANLWLVPAQLST